MTRVPTLSSETELLDELRAEALALFEILARASTLRIDGADVAREACANVARHLAMDDLVILVVGGERSLQRVLLELMVGRDAVGADCPATVFIRRGAVPNYVAKTEDGRTIEFARALPERDAAFERAIEQVERDREAAEALVAKSRAELDEARAKAARAEPPRLTEPAVGAPVTRQARLRWRILWQWMVRFIIELIAGARRRLGPGKERDRHPVNIEMLEPTLDLDPAVALEVAEDEHATATKKLESAQSHLAHIHDARTKYAEERREEFFRDLRDLADGGGRGAELVELVIEAPSERLPANVTLVDVPRVTVKTAMPTDAAAWKELRATIGGCIVVSEKGIAEDALAAELRSLSPHVVKTFPDAGDAVFDHVRQEWPLVRMARVLGALRAQLGSVVTAAKDAEAEVREEIALLELRRTPEIGRFQENQLAHMVLAISESAKGVLDKAIPGLHARIAQLKDEWKRAIETCEDRAGLEATIVSISEVAPARIASLAAALGEQIVADMQQASEALQEAAFAAVQARYKNVNLDAAGAADVASPVVSEVLAEDVVALGAAPLGASIEAFERRRVEIGLGGAATGAAIGTLVFPGVGTAVGAVLGVLAGLLERIETMKQDCIWKLHAYLDDAENQIRARLEQSREDALRDIRLSVEEALHEALERRKPAIVRLIAAENEALSAGRKRGDELAEVRALTEEHDFTLACLASAAAEMLRTYRVAR